ncbi:hypothetical protein [Nonomuraea sediminis]|uniref:hypothetical protein n=1 Tax=Nonomuraea sediminis TaxID=2835864 RepID=UPI001BDC5B28|nr:hypothetical protein [Nonomuraea sediminis]
MPVPDSACLEIHMLNVSHGDSVMIILRDVDKVKEKIDAVTPALTGVPADPIDWMPFAVANDVSLLGTVKNCLLVDGGDDFVGDAIVIALEEYGVVDPGNKGEVVENFSVMVSHFHDDHDQGLRTVFVEPPAGGVDLKDIIKTKWKVRYPPKYIYCSPRKHPRTPRTKNMPLFWQAFDLAVGADSKVVEIAEGGMQVLKATKHQVLLAAKTTTKKPLVIEFGDGVSYKGEPIPITITMLAAGAAVYEKTGKDKGTLQPVPSKVKKKKDGKKLWDENDRSLCFVLEYGSFRYFHGGDIAGDGMEGGGNTGKAKMPKKSTPGSGTHGDVEKILGPAMEKSLEAKASWAKDKDWFPNAGHCTVMKASHHASASSVDTYFLATVRPRIVLMSTGPRAKHHGHPTPAVMFRCDKATNPTWDKRGGGTAKNKVDAIYVTEITDTYTVTKKDGKKKKFVKKTFSMVPAAATKQIGDIVLRPIDGSIVDVRKATKSTALRVQVFGNGAKTTEKTTNTKARAGEPKNSPREKGAYLIGPYVHTLDP